MNRYHRWCCGSTGWATKVETVLLPWALGGADLGEPMLEIGPGLGVTTRLLVREVPRLTALEIDAGLARRLDRDLRGRAAVVCGDGAAMPFPDASFGGVVCFTMLHHVRSVELQDRLFAEVFRVLRPGASFAGTDSQPSVRWRLIHLFDTLVPIDPETLPARLEAAGFTDVDVTTGPAGVRFAARRPHP